MSKQTRVRSARTGRFVDKKKAKTSPKSTITETIKRNMWKKATLGLFEKFIVRRADGSDAPGKKHHGCRHFVLDLTHDPYAIQAILAYAKACRGRFPVLATDLVNLAIEFSGPSAPAARQQKSRKGR